MILGYYKKGFEISSFLLLLALFFICFLPFLHLIFSFLSISYKMRDVVYHNHLHPFPCLHCHPHTYIRMVQNLIERCLLLHMDRDQCVKALAEHARIRPLVTLTVWKELLKENRDFFQSYFQSLSPRPYYTSRNVQRAPRFARRNQWR